MTTIADRVRDARLAAGLSQTALAGSAFSPSYISLIEAGHREPTDSALAVLAIRLGTTLEFLKHGEDGPNEARTRLEIDYARLDLTQGDAAGAKRRLEVLDLDIVSPARPCRGPDHAGPCARGSRRPRVRRGDPRAPARGRTQPVAPRRARPSWPTRSSRPTSRPVTCTVRVEVGEHTLSELESAELTGTDGHLRLASTVLWAYVERGDLLYATHRAAELVRLAESLGTPRGRGSVYWNAALVAEQRRDYELAQRYTERALALLSEGEPDRDLPRLRLNYAWLLLRSEPADPTAALEQIERAAPDLAVLGSELELARVDVERSRAHLLLGDVGAAEEFATAALERLGEPPRVETAIAHLSFGDALHARGDLEGSARAYRLAADMLGMMSASRQSAAAWRDLGDRYALHGDTRRCRRGVRPCAAGGRFPADRAAAAPGRPGRSPDR